MRATLVVAARGDRAIAVTLLFCVNGESFTTVLCILLLVAHFLVVCERENKIHQICLANPFIICIWLIHYLHLVHRHFLFEARNRVGPQLHMQFVATLSAPLRAHIPSAHLSCTVKVITHMRLRPEYTISNGLLPTASPATLFKLLMPATLFKLVMHHQQPYLNLIRNS